MTSARLARSLWLLGKAAFYPSGFGHRLWSNASTHTDGVFVHHPSKELADICQINGGPYCEYLDKVTVGLVIQLAESPCFGLTVCLQSSFHSSHLRSTNSTQSRFLHLRAAARTLGPLIRQTATAGLRLLQPGTVTDPMHDSGPQHRAKAE